MPELPPGVVFRVLLLCDNFDALKGDVAAVRGFVDTVSAFSMDPAWGPRALKVVVTSSEHALGTWEREDELFGDHLRRVLLPLSTQQVRHVCGALQTHIYCHSLTRCPRCMCDCWGNVWGWGWGRTRESNMLLHCEQDR